MVGPLVVDYWVDLQSVHGFRCYDNIELNAKCQQVLVIALCQVIADMILSLLPQASLHCILSNIADVLPSVL